MIPELGFARMNSRSQSSNCVWRGALPASARLQQFSTHMRAPRLRIFGLWTLLGVVSSVQVYFAHRRLGPNSFTPLQALGAAYRGGTSLTTLASAGRVDADAETLAQVSVAFGWPVAPWCPVIF